MIKTLLPFTYTALFFPCNNIMNTSESGLKTAKKHDIEVNGIYYRITN